MENEVIELDNGINLNVNYNKKDDNKSTVLFLHFESSNLHVFNGVVPKFLSKYQVVIPDLRGHGESSKPKKAYRIKDLVKDLELLLKKLDIGKYYIVGSSLGAEVGIVLASRNQDMVNGVICEGVFSNEYNKYSLFEDDDEDIDNKVEEKLKEIDQRKQEYYETKSEFIETRVRFFQKAGMWNEYFDEYIKNNVCKDKKDRFTSCHPIYAEKQYLKNYYNFKIDKYYKNIQCPILFLPTKSAYDNEKIKNTINGFGKMAGNYEIKIIPGFTHPYGWMKLPNQTADVIFDFIKKY